MCLPPLQCPSSHIQAPERLASQVSVSTLHDRELTPPQAAHPSPPAQLERSLHTYTCMETQPLFTHACTHSLLDTQTQAHSQVSFFFFFCLLSFVSLGPHPQPMEVPRLGVQSELQPPAYTTATTTPDPKLVCDLHHSLRQGHILN